MAGKRPFEGCYGVTVATAVLALVPFIVVTSAVAFFRLQLVRELGATPTDIDVINDLAVAGYAFGALLGGGLIQHFRQRGLFLICESTFAVGAALVATAPNVPVFGAGYILGGCMTGLLLVVALPPVVQSFPARTLPITAAIVDLAFFGGVTLGAPLGGAIAASAGWRWLFGGLALLAAIVCAVATQTLPTKDPPNPGLPIDRAGIVLGFLGTVLPFWAVGQLTSHPFTSPIVVAPLAVGLACFFVLLVVEYQAKDPISPVKPMWNTMPVVGVLVSMTGGGAYFALFLLTVQQLVEVQHRAPLVAGLLFWPHVAGVIVAAGLFAVMLRTRFLALFALGGISCIIAGGLALLSSTADARSSEASILIAGALLGLGAGATVAPGLWFASLSLQSKMVGRIFALVELIRSEANFLLAPILLALAIGISGGEQASAAGIHIAIVVTIAITAGLSVIAAALYLCGGVGLQKPDLERWISGDQPAWTSPELLAPLRGRRPEQRTAGS